MVHRSRSTRGRDLEIGEGIDIRTKSIHIKNRTKKKPRKDVADAMNCGDLWVLAQCLHQFSHGVNVYLQLNYNDVDFLLRRPTRLHLLVHLNIHVTLDIGLSVGKAIELQIISALPNFDTNTDTEQYWIII